MRMSKWILAAAAVVVAIALAGCPMPTRPGDGPPGGGEEGEVWTTLFELATHEPFQALAIGTTGNENVFGGGGTILPTPLNGAGNPGATIVDSPVAGQARSLRLASGAVDWGQGFDMPRENFGFQVGDTITITGEILDLPAGRRIQVNRHGTAEDAFVGGVETIRDTEGPFEISFTLVASDLAAPNMAPNRGLRFEMRPDGVEVRIDNILIEGYRDPDAEPEPTPEPTPDPTPEPTPEGLVGTDVNLNPTVSPFMGIAVNTTMPVSRIYRTAAGEFAELHLPRRAGNDADGLEIVLNDNIADNWPDGLAGANGPLSGGGTYTITVTGRTTATGDIRLQRASDPWAILAYEALVPGEDFEISTEFTTDASGSGNTIPGRIRVRGSVAGAQPIIITSVIIENADGDVVWDLAEVLFQPPIFLAEVASGQFVHGLDRYVVLDVSLASMVTEHFGIGTFTVIPPSGFTVEPAATGQFVVAPSGTASFQVRVRGAPTASTPVVIGIEGMLGFTEIAGEVSVPVVAAPTGVTVTPTQANVEYMFIPAAPTAPATQAFTGVPTPATAYQADILWSVQGSPAGVSISAAGVLSVTNVASPGEIIVVASPDGFPAVTTTRTVQLVPAGAAVVTVAAGTGSMQVDVGGTLNFAVSGFNIAPVGTDTPFTAAMIAPAVTGLTVGGTFTVTAGGILSGTLTLTSAAGTGLTDGTTNHALTVGTGDGQATSEQFAVVISPEPTGVPDWSHVLPFFTENWGLPDDNIVATPGGIAVTQRANNANDSLMIHVLELRRLVDPTLAPDTNGNLVRITLEFPAGTETINRGATPDIGDLSVSGTSHTFVLNRNEATGEEAGEYGMWIRLRPVPTVDATFTITNVEIGTDGTWAGDMTDATPFSSIFDLL